MLKLILWRGRGAVRAQDGRVLAFGEGTFGALGLGGEESAWVPRALDALPGGAAAAHVACSGFIDTNLQYIFGATAVVDAEGGIHTFGSGQLGALGHGGQANELRPRALAGARGPPAGHLRLPSCYA